MFISFPCSNKVFNIWVSILIIACFCNNFMCKIIGFILLLFLIFKNLISKQNLQRKVVALEETGFFPVETIFSIALALNEKVKVLKANNNIDSFKSQFDFLLFDIKNRFPEINLKSTETLTRENIKPIIKHIEQQIAFIKQQITPENKDILEQQLSAYFLLLVLCYNKIYKDLNNLSNEILKELS